MKPFNVRLPAAMIEALRLQAQAHNLDLSAHVRSQLAAALTKPANILNTAQEVHR